MISTILIAGGTGLVGRRLTELLEQQGKTVRLLTRSPKGKNQFAWDPAKGTIDEQAVFGVDAVINLAGAGIADARLMFNYQKRHAPLRRTVTIEEIGGSGIYLLSDLSTGVTGEIHYVDSGYNIVSMPHPEALKTVDAAETAAEALLAKTAAE